VSFAEKVKAVLLERIHEMAANAWLFVQNPESDFTRKRKLDFETMLQCLIAMESGSLQKELLEMFRFSMDTATASAFYQQRGKILPEALEFLFREFNKAFGEYKTLRGYRLLACDGTSLNIARNPDDQENYYQTAPDAKGYNLLHLNAMYDFQPGRTNNECRAMTDMIDRYDSRHKTIFLADRGYESYNIFAHVEQREMFYLIRVKDRHSKSILSSLSLPQRDEFDTNVHLTLTRKQTKHARACSGVYKFLPNNSTFDYLDQNECYPITLRIVRFPLSADTYECVITNLPNDEFPPDELKKLYAMRWGIETSFRELKYAIGLSCFHTKKVEYIKQEIFARLVLYNFCEIITTHVVTLQKDSKYVYQINYTMAIHICRYFLRCSSDISPPNVELLLHNFLLPVRPGRSDPRKVTPKSVVSFLYRVA
jgi:Transposase DDE domain